jgi:thiamine biosynthesis lipoprotein
LGTRIEIKVPNPSSSFFPLCVAECARIESAYSRFLDSSVLAELNRNRGKWMPASDELLFLLSAAVDFSRRTEGNFDLSLKRALEELGYDKDYSFKPKKPLRNPLSEAWRNALPAFEIDRKTKRVCVHREIEFGGLGKGFALDRVAAVLSEHGVDHFYINAGGDIFAKRAEGLPEWEILLEHPDDPDRAIGKISLSNGAIAGSAANRRKWGDSHHLLNAKTKKPQMGVKAIFVRAQTGIEADAYATALFCAGFEDGIRLSKTLPVEVLMVSAQDKMFQSKGFEAELFD